MKVQELKKFVETRLEGTPYYLIEVREESGDRFVVEIDSDDGVDIDFCTDLAQAIDAEFPREEGCDDYELEVGSAGLTSPFKVLRQYQKNIGQDVEVLTRDGRKMHGVLRAADPDKFTLEYTVKEKPEGSKRPVEVSKREDFPYDAVKSVQVDLKF